MQTDQVRRADLVRSAFVLNSDELGRRVVSGASFTFLGIALRTLLTLGSVSVLARLLSPADFGYIAMATVVTEFAALFSSFGLANILIQRRVVSRVQLDTVFWTSALIGVVVTIVVFGLSYFADLLFADATTGQLLRVLCSTFFLGGLTAVHEAILSRLMRFRTEFHIQITAVAARAGVAIAFAYLGFGVWSLVAGALAGSLTIVILSVIAIPYLPRFRFHYAYLASTWHISGSYLGRGLLYYSDTNIDLLLIGRYLGATSLGYYQNARSLTDEIRGRIAIPLQRVLFPAFAALQSDQRRLQDSVVRSGRLVAALVIPIGFGTSAIAAELVPILYGAKWTAMIPVVAMLGISTALRASTAIASPIFNATNNVGLALRYSFLGTLLTAGSVVMTLPYGVAAVSGAVAASSLYSLVTFRVGLGLIGLNSRNALAIIGPPMLAALAMWLAIFGLRSVTMTWAVNIGILIAIHIAAGATVYAIVLNLLSKHYKRDFVELGRRLLRRS